MHAMVAPGVRLGHAEPRRGLSAAATAEIEGQHNLVAPLAVHFRVFAGAFRVNVGIDDAIETFLWGDAGRAVLHVRGNGRKGIAIHRLLFAVAEFPA